MRLFLLLLALSGPAWASSGESYSAADLAERTRLQEELENYAIKNQWKGTEKVFVKLEALTLPLRPDDWLRGALGAFARGDLVQGHRRLEKAVGERPVADEEGNFPPMEGARSDAWQSLQSFEARFGMVALRVGPNRVPGLVKMQAPFARDERYALEAGRKQLSKKRMFTGFLPIGRYMVDGQFFEVQPGGTAVEVTVGEIVKAPSTPTEQVGSAP